MTRRILRTVTQLGAAVLLLFILVAFLDRNYRVLPTAIHNYMPSHHPGHVVTDVTVVTCSSIKPFSSCDPSGPEWQIVNRELYLGRAWTSKAYMYVNRKREEELTAEDEVVTDIAIGGAGAAADESGYGEHWEARPAGLWVKRATNKKSFDSNLVVTDIDVIFGDDATEARQGWGIVGKSPLDIGTDGDLHSVHVTIKRGVPAEVKRPKLRIPDTGRFRVMQVADLHLSTGVGDCREPVPDGYKGGKCQADPRTLDFVAKMLDEEKPDLVVLSGDQVNGATAPDAPSAIYKFASLLAQRKIPWAAIFGNHDNEHTITRAAQMALMETLPYSLSRAGPDDVDGVGNYYVEVLGRGHNDHSALTIYLLDTHGRTPDKTKSLYYDWLQPNQIDWFKRTSASLRKNHDGYTHRHMNMAFIHIPIPEYMDWDLPRVGKWREGVSAPNVNSGFRDALVEEGVVMVGAGHDHANEFCALSSIGDVKKDFAPGWEKHMTTAEEKTAQANAQKTPALWMCYAGGSGLGGYGGYDGYVRRIRMFEIDTEEARITTWKRIEADDGHDGGTRVRVDEQIIVEAGKAYLPK